MRTGLWVFALMFGWVLQAQAQVAQTNRDDLISILQKTQNWGLIRAGSSCVEQYQFLASGEVHIQSNKERISGHYQYLVTDQGFSLPALVISFAQDNRQVDCGGSSVDQTGTSTTNFLKKVSDQQIFFCNDALGKDCPVYLRPEH